MSLAAASGEDFRRSLLAGGLAVAGHVAVLGLLLAGWQPDPPAAAQVRTLTTQVVEIREPALPPAQPVTTAAPPVEAPAPMPEPAQLAPPVPVEIAPPPPEAVLAEPVTPPKPAPVDDAALARKRAEQEQREQQRRAAEERAHQQAQARARAEAEAAAAREAAARAAEAAKAEAAKAAQAADAAEREAASRPYLPIEKEEPEYPPRALDKRIEGDCTVVYRVNAQGRVEDPQALDDCHPLFVNPSLAAARRFRYLPRMVSGRAVAVESVRNTFRFRIK